MHKNSQRIQNFIIFNVWFKNPTQFYEFRQILLFILEPVEIAQDSSITLKVMINSEILREFKQYYRFYTTQFINKVV